MCVVRYASRLRMPRLAESCYAWFASSDVPTDPSMPPSPPDHHQRNYHALPMPAHEHDYAPHQFHLPEPHQPRASIFGRLGSMHADPLGHVHDPQHDVYRQGQHFGGFEMLADVSAMVERPGPRCLGMPMAESDEMDYAPPTPDDDVPMLGSSSATVRAGAR